MKTEETLKKEIRELENAVINDYHSGYDSVVRVRLLDILKAELKGFQAGQQQAHSEVLKIINEMIERVRIKSDGRGDLLELKERIKVLEEKKLI